MTGGWVRLHRAPRHVTRGAAMGGLGRLSARGQWYYQRSLERWRRRPGSEELERRMQSALASGMIGTYSGVRIIENSEREAPNSERAPGGGAVSP